MSVEHIEVTFNPTGWSKVLSRSVGVPTDIHRERNERTDATADVAQWGKGEYSNGKESQVFSFLRFDRNIENS